MVGQMKIYGSTPLAENGQVQGFTEEREREKEEEEEEEEEKKKKKKRAGSQKASTNFEVRGTQSSAPPLWRAEAHPSLSAPAFPPASYPF